MSPRHVNAIVFLTGIVTGSVISFFSIRMLSSSSLKTVELSDSHHYMGRKMDIDLLCNVSRKSHPDPVQRAKRTDSPLSESVKSSLKENDKRPSRTAPMNHDEINKLVISKEEIHLVDEHHHKGNFSACSYEHNLLLMTLAQLK